MKFLTEYRNPELVKFYLNEIEKIVTKPWNIMEICGGQTHSLVKNGLLELLTDKVRMIQFGSSKEFPDYIPDVVRNDYKEACLIKDLSPKASATLARRCLQGMIRDFWKVSKKNLYEEINALKELIPAAQWKVLDSVRKIGNIGAHMEKDIDVIIEIEPHEAERLIRLIEFLMKEWYINRHETQLLFEEITQIADDKKISKTILKNS